MCYELKLTPELAEIAGIHAGDGYLRFKGKRKEFDISGSVDEKSYYDEHVIPLFNEIFGLSIKGRYFRSRNTYGFTTGNSFVISVMASLGFPSGKKTTSVMVPRAILESEDTGVIASFLRGYFDTDGCLSFDKKIRNTSLFQRTYNYYPRLLFSTCSAELCEGFRELLTKLGFSYRFYTSRPRKETESLKYRSQITGNKALADWMRLVGSKNTSKLSRYWIWKKFGFCPPNTTYQQRLAVLNGRLDPFTFYHGPVA